MLGAIGGSVAHARGTGTARRRGAKSAAVIGGGPGLDGRGRRRGGSCRLLTLAERPGHRGAPSLLGHPDVDPADLVDQSLPHRVLQVEDRVERPVEVVGDVRDLLPEAVGRVRQDPPGASPAMSTANSWLQEGQVTAASVWPSWLMRR